MRTKITSTLLVVALASSMLADIVRYDPGLGSQPTNQGFVMYQTNYPGSQSSAQPPIVANGVLHQLPTTGQAYQDWYHTNMSIDFTTTSYALDADLRVISSNYTNDGTKGGVYHRCGYYFDIIDRTGRRFAIGISSTGIAINTDESLRRGQGFPFTAFDTTNVFHNYRFVIANAKGTLFIDGLYFASLAVGSAALNDVSSKIVFGDASWNGISETELRQFRFLSLDTTLSITRSDISQVRLCWNSEHRCLI